MAALVAMNLSYHGYRLYYIGLAVIPLVVGILYTGPHALPTVNTEAVLLHADILQV